MKPSSNRERKLENSEIEDTQTSMIRESAKSRHELMNNMKQNTVEDDFF